ncbi:MAG: hypothetical protein JSS76_09135 [Bacteroidetes bacterium]|nr:hypothetical protein [Bacteroidota bacterium]
MKASLFISILLLLGTDACAQQTLIANAQLKVLYRNFDNHISMAKSGYDCDQIKLIVRSRSLSDSITVHGTGCEYVVRTCIYGCIDLIASYTDQKSVITYHDTTTFIVKDIQAPYITLGGRLRGGTCHASVIRAMPGLVAIGTTDLPYRCDIYSFQLKYLRKGHRKSIVLTAPGPLFTNEMQALLAHLRKGDKVIIDHVIASYAGMLAEDIGGITFTISDSH